MADWTQIRTALGAWVASVTGLPVYWQRRPRGWAATDTGYVLLDLAGRRTVGMDEVSLEYDATAAPGAEIRQYQGGQRQFTLVAQVRTWRSTTGYDALHYTSLIRDRLCLPSTAAAFAVAEVAYARILSDVGPLSYEQDGREMDVADIQIRFNAASLVEDRPTGYVELLQDLELYEVDNPVPPIWRGDIEV